MTGIKPSSHGIVVDHLESGVRYAVSDKNYNEKIHRKVRNLRPSETVIGYQPKRLPDALNADSQESTEADQTEGAAPAASQEKEGK